MFHIGIIGCGKIAQVRHIPEYADNPDTQLTAFYDLNAARAQELAERYGARSTTAWKPCWKIRTWTR